MPKQSTQPAEDKWREAKRRLDQAGNPAFSRLYRLEQEAWDEYVDACQDQDECQMPGCHAWSDGYAYCDAHRENDG